MPLKGWLYIMEHEISSIHVCLSCVLRVLGIGKGDESSTSSPRLICCGERDADRGIRNDTYISTRYQQLYHSRYFVWSSTGLPSVDGFGWPVELVMFNRIGFYRWSIQQDIRMLVVCLSYTRLDPAWIGLCRSVWNLLVLSSSMISTS